MDVLVVGATGATGRLLVGQLLDRGVTVRAVVRDPSRLPTPVREHPGLTTIEGAILDLSPDELAGHVQGCHAVASCLGHNLSFRGLFGPPHRLVTETARRICRAIRSHRPSSPVRYLLMNTTGNRDPDADAGVSLPHRIVVGALRVLLPPHADNEQAAAYLRSEVGHEDPFVEWVVVRPDSLIDRDAVTAYDVVPSPTRDAIFNAGKTRRIHVAHFLARLATDDELWDRWKGRMPVLYDRDPDA